VDNHPIDKPDQHMGMTKPVIYLLIGDDEFGIQEFIQSMKEKLGDAATAALNLVEFDGRNVAWDALRNAASAVPFLAERRLVILNHPLAFSTKTPSEREAYLRFLEQIPPTTAIVLPIEDEMKWDSSWNTMNDGHWLMRWVKEQGGRVYQKIFIALKGRALADHLVKESGQRISADAALRLVDLIGDEPRQTKMELDKLLAYVNYARVIEMKDVEAVTSQLREENVFDYIDALGTRDGKKAAQSLARLLEQQDGQAVFSLVVRQFRLLLQSKELIEKGHSAKDIQNMVGDVRFISTAQKLVIQARYFSIHDLETIFKRLVEIDEDVKTGKIDVDTSLYLLTAALAQS
jgi:DNA polymerase-3 subunit delta